MIPHEFPFHLHICFSQDDETFDEEDTAGPPTSRRRESRTFVEDDEYDVEMEQNVLQSTKRARQSVLNDSDEDS